jgi:histone H3/H4
MSQENLIVGSKVKALVSEAGMRSDGNLATAVSDRVREIVQAAIERAQKNGRSTVRPHDL